MSHTASIEESSLTKYPSASFRELIYLSLPLIFSLFSASFMGFCDRLFLAKYSLNALEESVCATYLCILFQHPLVRITSMAQVFVGLYKGANQLNRIGACVWQMIWFSLFSMAITLPLSQGISSFFFQGTVVQESANTYFNVLMTVNFLYPLSTALISYFSGQGRMRVIFLTTLLCHGLNIGLDYLFIFGHGSWIPEMGIFGAAFATAISQGMLCFILLCFFLRKKDHETYGTRNYRLNWSQFWMQLRTGLPRGIARIIILSAWALTARVMVLKGGDYLMVLTIGGSLILFFTFIHEGVCQGIITVASNLIGAKDFKKIWKLVRSSLILLVCITVLLAIPYLIAPEWMLTIFFSEALSPESLPLLKISCVWVWLYFLSYGFQTIGFGLVTAGRDVTFYMCVISFIWITSYTPVYLGMNYFNWSPDKLWLMMAIDSLLYGSIYLYRSTKAKWKTNHAQFESALMLNK